MENTAIGVLSYELEAQIIYDFQQYNSIKNLEPPTIDFLQKAYDYLFFQALQIYRIHSIDPDKGVSQCWKYKESITVYCLDHNLNKAIKQNDNLIILLCMTLARTLLRVEWSAYNDKGITPMRSEELESFLRSIF